MKTEPEVIDFTAGMEQTDADEESQYFKNLESRQLDAAQAKNGTYSAYLNNASEFASNRGIGGYRPGHHAAGKPGRCG